MAGYLAATMTSSWLGLSRAARRRLAGQFQRMFAAEGRPSRRMATMVGAASMPTPSWQASTCCTCLIFLTMRAGHGGFSFLILTPTGHVGCPSRWGRQRRRPAPGRSARRCGALAMVKTGLSATANTFCRLCKHNKSMDWVALSGDKDCMEGFGEKLRARARELGLTDAEIELLRRGLRSAGWKPRGNGAKSA